MLPLGASATAAAAAVGSSRRAATTTSARGLRLMQGGWLRLALDAVAARRCVSTTSSSSGPSSPDPAASSLRLNLSGGARRSLSSLSSSNGGYSLGLLNLHLHRQHHGRHRGFSSSSASSSSDSKDDPSSPTPTPSSSSSGAGPSIAEILAAARARSASTYAEYLEPEASASSPPQQQAKQTKQPQRKQEEVSESEAGDTELSSASEASEPDPSLLEGAELFLTGRPAKAAAALTRREQRRLEKKLSKKERRKLIRERSAANSKKELRKTAAASASENFSLTGEAREERLRSLEPEADSVAPRFRKLGLRADLCLGVRALGITDPTPAQRLAIPPLLKGESCLLSAQTGTGKTLAFLLPLVQRLKEEERRTPQAANVPHGHPRALILVPNRELGQQTHRIAKLLSHVAKVRVGTLIGGKVGKSKKLTLSVPLDILISTPGRLINLQRTRDLSLSRVRIVVVDEADTMFHPTNGFGPELDEALAPIWGRMSKIEDIRRRQALQAQVLAGTASEADRENLEQQLKRRISIVEGGGEPHFLERDDLWKQRTVQWMLACATLDRFSRENLLQLFPFCKELSAPDTHTLVGVEKLRTHYIDVRGGDKMLALLSVLDREGLKKELKEKQRAAHEALERRYAEAAQYQDDVQDLDALEELSELDQVDSLSELEAAEENLDSGSLLEEDSELDLDLGDMDMADLQGGGGGHVAGVARKLREDLGLSQEEEETDAEASASSSGSVFEDEDGEDSAEDSALDALEAELDQLDRKLKAAKAAAKGPPGSTGTPAAAKPSPSPEQILGELEKLRKEFVGEHEEQQPQEQQEDAEEEDEEFAGIPARELRQLRALRESKLEQLRAQRATLGHKMRSRLEYGPEAFETPGPSPSVILAPRNVNLPGLARDGDQSSMIVFCNTIPSVRAVEHRLSAAGYLTSCYHGDMPPDTRNREFRRFETGETKILVCSDIAARGLDTGWVGHVVLFDFPLNPIDYIHRVGRTARAGRGGRVTALVSKGDQVLANAIAEAHLHGLPVDDLSSDRRVQQRQLHDMRAGLWKKGQKATTLDAKSTSKQRSARKFLANQLRYKGVSGADPVPAHGGHRGAGPRGMTHMERALGVPARAVSPSELGKLYRETQMAKAESVERQQAHEEWTQMLSRRKKLKSRSWGEQRRIRDADRQNRRAVLGGGGGGGRGGGGGGRGDFEQGDDIMMPRGDGPGGAGGPRKSGVKVPGHRKGGGRAAQALARKPADPHLFK